MKSKATIFYHRQLCRWVLTALLFGMFINPLLAQTCNPSVFASAPASRFKNNNNGTVNDLSTGLTWQRCSVGQSGADCDAGSTAFFSWDQALQQADKANNDSFAGFNDWRLPNINELFSLVEISCDKPAINLSVFPATPSEGYWSSSPDAYFSGGAWLVNFYLGFSYYFLRDFDSHVRLVRGGQ